MHYLGMAATRFSRGAYCTGGVPIDNHWLPAIVGLVTIALLAIVLITGVFDAHLQSHTLAQTERLREVNAELQREAAKAQSAQDLLAEQDARSRASEERLRQISDSLPALIAYWDRDMICRFANQAHFERFGLAPDQIVGMSFGQVFGNDQTDPKRLRMRAALAGERQMFDSTVVGRKGKSTHWQSDYVPHWDKGRVVGCYALIIDITQRKTAEQRLSERLGNRRFTTTAAPASSARFRT